MNLIDKFYELFIKLVNISILIVYNSEGAVNFKNNIEEDIR